MGRHEAVVEYEALARLAAVVGRLLLDGPERVAWRDLSPTLMFGPFEGLRPYAWTAAAPVHWDVLRAARHVSRFGRDRARGGSSQAHRAGLSGKRNDTLKGTTTVVHADPHEN
jgi:hypothetical protein